MKLFVALPLVALAASPIAAQQSAPLSYDDRITCSALLFLSSQGAEDPKMEESFAAHHLSKAIESSGKPQDEAIADTQNRMDALSPALEREDPAIMETYANCIMTVINEFE